MFIRLRPVVAGVTACLFAIAVTLQSQIVNGQISSCSSSVNIHSVTPSSQNSFDFDITSGDPQSIAWIKITRPSSNFTIVSTSSSDWATNVTEEFVEFSGNTLSPGSLLNIVADAGPSEAVSANWVVEVSPSGSGLDPTTCGGSLGTSIDNSTGPTIYNVSVSILSNTSVRISWSTNEPTTSQVRYGATSSYGTSTPSDDNPKTNHSVQIDGLSPGSAYHYQAVSRDVDSNEATSGDSTFLTPLTSATAEVSNTPFKTKIAIKSKPTEKVPPTISLTTPFNKPYKESPTITGNAVDNEALAGIEYSTDAGQNWLEVDAEQGLGTKTASFSFRPINLEDGNYKVIMRAIDTSGNIGYSQAQTLIIDRLPPMVGGNIISVGAQILTPSSDGVITSLAGVDENITMSAVGGATDVAIYSSLSGGAKPDKNFTLSRSQSSGLWSGVISFEEAGVYKLTAQSIDGAGNKTTRLINTVYVHPSPKLMHKGSVDPISGAKITLYYLEPTSNNWTIWDGQAYGQKNPQKSDNKGQYRLFVPPGKYYLRAEAPHHRILLSNIFEVKNSSPILSNLYMKEARSIKIGPAVIHIPPFSNDKIDFKVDEKPVSITSDSSVQVGKNIPGFSLLNNKGQSVNSVSLSGKPTVLSFVSSWSPASKDQIPVLSRLQNNKDINIVPVVTQERAGPMNAISQISGNPLSFLQDPDGITVQQFNINSLPTHYFLDRHGVVKKVMIGTLTSEEIIKNMVGL